MSVLSFEKPTKSEAMSGVLQMIIHEYKLFVYLIIIIIYLLSVCYISVSITVRFIDITIFREMEVSKLKSVVHKVASTP